jgi:uncharacterized membrane protein
MSADKPILIYIGAYDSVLDAEDDLEAVRELHHDKLIGTYDAAIVTKNDEGKPQIVRKTEKPTQHGAWTGLGVGAVVGLLFPAVLVGAAAGAVIGGVVEHFHKGLSRGDLKELGELLDEGEACLVVIGEVTIEKALDDAVKKAKKTLKKQVDADADELKKAIDEA